MTIHLPEDLECYVRSQVQSGCFASEDEAIAEAVRLLRRQLSQRAAKSPVPGSATAAPDPLLGALRDAADEMDEIVAAAMRQREQQPWRLPPGE